MIRPWQRLPLLVHMPVWADMREREGMLAALAKLGSETSFIAVADSDQYRIEYVGPKRFVSRFRKRRHV